MEAIDRLTQSKSEDELAQIVPIAVAWRANRTAAYERKRGKKMTETESVSITDKAAAGESSQQSGIATSVLGVL